jgi:hypothetical protein
MTVMDASTHVGSKVYACVPRCVCVYVAVCAGWCLQVELPTVLELESEPAPSVIASHHLQIHFTYEVL